MLISFSGKLRAGKDTAADFLVDNFGFVKHVFSDAIHEAMLKIDPHVYYDWKTERLVRYSSVVESLGYTKAKELPEVRRLLQRLGTEVGREMIDENVWVDIMDRKIQADASKKIVVSGVRYPNELNLIRHHGGLAVYVFRTENEKPVEGEVHKSESSLQPGDFDAVITNDGTLDDLYAKVDELRRELKGEKCD